MTNYQCVVNQSFSDVCLNTYGTIDNYIRLLTDNALTPNTIPHSGQIITWDETLVKNQTIQKLTADNGIIYATLYGYGPPLPAPNPIGDMFKDILQAQHTATIDGETEIAMLATRGSELITVIKEVRPLKEGEFEFDAVTGTISLLNGLSLVTDETLTVLHKKNVRT